jgi:hypothetical protein
MVDMERIAGGLLVFCIVLGLLALWYMIDRHFDQRFRRVMWILPKSWQHRLFPGSPYLSDKTR